MAQLRVKQIFDFVSGVAAQPLSTAAATAVGSINTVIGGLDSIYATDVQLSSGVSVEKLRAETAEGVIASNLTGEITRAKLAEGANATNLTAEISRAKLAEGANATNLVNAKTSIDTVIGGLDSIYATDVQLSSGVSVEKLRAETAEGVIASNLTTEGTARVSGDLSLSTRLGIDEAALTTEVTRAKGIEAGLRTDVNSAQADIDAILTASTADKDSFAEIVALINSVDTANDTAFGNYVISNNASVDSLEVALSAEIAATNSDVTRIDAALAAEITATNSDVTRIDAKDLAQDGRLTTLENGLAAEISATNSDVTRIDAKDLAQDGRLTTLENGLAAEISATNSDINALGGRIDLLEGLSDSEVIADWFVDNEFTVPFAFDMNAHVAVFVNGLQIHEFSDPAAEGFTTVDGLKFKFNLGYVVDDKDHVVVSGRLA